MVVMDDQYNGWRYLTLPMTLSDEMLMNAVLAVSAFHISHRTEGRLPVKPNKLYAQAILGLQSRRALNDFDMATRQSVFLTIIILMVGVMITGCSDFPILFHMLQSALDAIGGESGLGGGEIAEFLMRQIHKMRVYAAPLLSPEAGVHHILAYSQQSFDCLHYNGDLHPDHASTFYLVAYLRQQAYDIYLQRALAGPSAVIQPDLVERYKSTLDLFAHDSPGTHSLIWPTFIAASESRLAEHRLHFKQFLEVQYRSNGFSNILEALKLLERIWACQDTNWTALLPEPRVFIM
ncbi:hypothetical protein BDV25DRAFT_129162 [Aspergillus avenaceus]|uniref:Fungal-specific transcription factor domain-containing protein n=1 Tax=Aspergillus avenaceus TaxID=36643 RepID=A0A5N6TY39_ASPAV|nr:hypothetical protein BDV25DRAFT_129162 [Aspergillus avenaceus]